MPILKKSSACSFCSRNDFSVQVICEGRCMLCDRCGQLPSIRQLLLSFTNRSVNEKSNILASTVGGAISSPGKCPLCNSAMSRSMYLLIRDFLDSLEDSKAKSFKSDVNLDHHDSFFVEFLINFRRSYGNLGTDIQFPGELNGQSEVFGAPICPSGLNSYSYISDSRKMNNGGPSMINDGSNIADAGSTTLLRQIDKDQKKNDVPILTNAEAMACFADCICFHWQYLSKGGNEGLSLAVQKVCHKKKSSQRLNDFRLKSLIDYICSSGGRKASMGILFGQLLGFLPRPSHMLRPALDSITTALFVLAYCGEKCFASMELCDENGSPTVGDLKAKLHKFSVIKYINIRQAFFIIQFLIKIRQPHFCMAPMTSKCVEADTAMPWEADSINRLIHLIGFVILGDRGAMLSENVPSRPTTAEMDPDAICSKIASTGISVPVFDHSAMGKTVFPPDDSSTFNLTNVPPTETLSVGETAIMDAIGNKPASKGSAINHPATLGRLKLLNAKAAEIWNAAPRKSHHPDDKKKHCPANFFEIGRVDYFALVSADDTEKQLEEQQEKRISGTFSYLTFETASNVMEDLSISVAELILAVLAGWEAEYNYIVKRIAASASTITRRFALKGTFDETSAAMNLSLSDRAILIRIIRWYQAEFPSRVEMDWLDVKERALSKGFPFSVPASITDKTPAELNFHHGVIQEHFHERKVKEKFEDIEYSFQMGLQVPTTRPGTGSFQYRSGMYESITLPFISSSNGSVASRNSVSSQTSKQQSDAFNILYINHDEDKNRTIDSRGAIALQGDGFDLDGCEDDQSVGSIRPLTPTGLLDANFSNCTLDADKIFPQLIRSTPSRGLDTPSSPSNRKATGGSRSTHSLSALNGYEDSRSERPESPSRKYFHGKAMQTKSAPILSINHSNQNVTFDKAKLRVIQRLEKLENPFVSLLESQKIAFHAHVDIGTRLNVRPKSGVPDREAAETLIKSNLDAQSIVLKSRLLTEMDWNDIITNFFNPNQLLSLRKLEFSGINLDPVRANQLNIKLATQCRLADINLFDNSLGDIGVYKLLDAMVKSGGHRFLLSLGVAKNGISFANGSLKVLTKFARLRSLDLGHNRLSLDIRKQQQLFTEVIAALTDLESFSVAFNTIQSHGFEIVCQLVVDNLRKLKLLDCTRCNLTGSCIEGLKKLVDPKIHQGIEEILLLENLFTMEQTAAIKQLTHKSPLLFGDSEDASSKDVDEQSIKRASIKLDGYYNGIELPLRYSVNENGGVI